MREVVEHEWGAGLIRSWNTAGWITCLAAHRRQDRAPDWRRPGEVVVADSTSANLYKVLSAAIAVRAGAPTHRPAALGSSPSARTSRPTSTSPRRWLARTASSCVLIDADDLAARFDDRLAILMLTHVNYRTGRMFRMAEVTRAAHAAGAMVIWDLAHSAGAMPVDVYAVDVRGDAADFAVGCGYKYLNGGPGAPAFVWAHPDHTAWMDRHDWRQPLSGWLGHAEPFAFTTEYRPAAGILRFVCGTPPVVALAALECGVDTVLAAEAHGGLAAVRGKSLALTDLFISLVESRCARHGLTLVTPRQTDDRGSQASFAHPTAGYEMMQALIARGVIGDFRAPDILRFGFTPLYTRFVDAWDAVDRFALVLAQRGMARRRASRCARR